MTRWWGKNICIDGRDMRKSDDTWEAMASRDAERWETDVQDVFRTIECSQTGKLLMRLINGISGKNILVFPIRQSNSFQTAAKPWNWNEAMKSGHRFKAGPADSVSGSPNAAPSDLSPHSDLFQGHGTGSNVRLYFHPGTWKSSAQMRAVDELAGVDMRKHNYRPDDVLFHECVHCYRAMKGIFELVPTGDTWHATEEFMAIVLTNIYVSETRPGAALRGDHEPTFATLKEAGRAESDVSFYTTNFALLDRMREEMRELIDPLTSSVPSARIADWNPFRIGQEMERNRMILNSGELTR